MPGFILANFYFPFFFFHETPRNRDDPPSLLAWFWLILELVELVRLASRSSSLLPLIQRTCFAPGNRYRCILTNSDLIVATGCPPDIFQSCNDSVWLHKTAVTSLLQQVMGPLTLR